MKLETKLEELDFILNKMALEKRLQIEAEHLKRIKIAKIVRIYTVIENKSLKVFIRILNNLTGELKVDSIRIWELIKRIVIISTDEIYEWTAESQAEAFLVKNINLNKPYKLLIKFNNFMGLFKLDDKLKILLNLYADSKPNVIKEIYKYINNKGLLNHTTGIVTSDKSLENIFNVTQFDFNDISSMLDEKLFPIDYCNININLNNTTSIYDVEVDIDDITQMPILYSSEVKMLIKKIEGNKILEKKLKGNIKILQEFIKNPIQMISKFLILEKDIKGIKTKYFDDLNIQTALFELLINKKNSE
ncbi:SWIB-domain-containing protein [Enterocytozoon bieneusi H348]|nr:SWIB-domain-containing protein [Enterocytozoon bieneusi H348]|eukprot:XP_002649778.1 SWIB-domain-containing protein [Enterocytozoon bieneusi H348]